MVVKVDLASWREEGVSQFSSDAVETVVQVGLQTVGVVNGVEACQDTDIDRQAITPGGLEGGLHYLCSLLGRGADNEPPKIPPSNRGGNSSSLLLSPGLTSVFAPSRERRGERDAIQTVGRHEWKFFI